MAQEKLTPDTFLESLQDFVASVKESSDRALDLQASKDAGYGERNQLVLVLAKLLPGKLYRDESPDAEEGYRWVVSIPVPGVQNRRGGPFVMTWHIHDAEKPLFDFLPVSEADFDGTTTEEKYAILTGLSPVTLLAAMTPVPPAPPPPEEEPA